MSYLYQWFIILIMLLLGKGIHLMLHNWIDIPGAIWGMILLFFALTTNIVKEKKMATLSHFFIKLLPFFLLAKSLSLVNLLPLIRENWLVIAWFGIGVTAITLSCTMKIIDIMYLRRNKK